MPVHVSSVTAVVLNYVDLHARIHVCRIITVHGRTKEQKGRLVAGCDWDAIRRVKEALPVPVFSNGAISSSKDVERRVFRVAETRVVAVGCCCCCFYFPFALFLFLFARSQWARLLVHEQGCSYLSSRVFRPTSFFAIAVTLGCVRCVRRR